MSKIAAAMILVPAAFALWPYARSLLGTDRQTERDEAEAIGRALANSRSAAHWDDDDDAPPPVQTEDEIPRPLYADSVVEQWQEPHEWIHDSLDVNDASNPLHYTDMNPMNPMGNDW
ncbi:hypothetical protein LJR168_003921 [Pseudoxanthomonas sp. LjRoot168]|uniref:hypothetical protein n=1 Tax=unclassified Pseudoxanthomonas TaxID=2645906 RepID=UPI003ECE97C5